LARSSEKCFTTLVCKFSIIKRRLIVWEESIGLLRLDEGRDGVLDQVIGHQEIEGVLQQISTLLQDAETLKRKYGVAVDSTNEDGQPTCIKVSRYRRDIFKQHSIVDFLSRLAAHQRKSIIITKTRWATRDSKRFIALVDQLDRFVTKLTEIDVSCETHIRQDMAILEELESIVDLATLSIMEQTCRGPNRSWATAARIHSNYLSSVGSVVERNERIQAWDADAERIKSNGQSMSSNGRRRKRKSYKPLSPSRSPTRVYNS